MKKKSVDATQIHDKVLQLLYQTIDEFNQQHENVCIEKAPNTALLSCASGLDSLMLVNFIVAAEQKIEEEFEVAISAIANERALSQKSSPLRNVSTLAEFISSILAEQLK